MGRVEWRCAGSPRLSKTFVPLAPRGDSGSSGILGLWHQLDSLVDGGDGVERLGVGGVEEDEGVGSIFLAQRPGFVVGSAEEAGGRGGFETERGGVVGLEEGEKVGGQLEQLVA